MKKTKIFVAGACAVALASAIAVPAFGAGLGQTDATATGTATVTDLNTGGSANLSIKTEKTTVSITVPTDAAIVFAADGQNYAPTNFNITNNSLVSDVNLTKIEVKPTGDWSIVSAGTAIGKDQHKLAMKLGESGSEATTTDGTYDYSATPIKIAKKLNASTPATATTLSFIDIERASFTSTQDFNDAFTMKMTFDWA